MNDQANPQNSIGASENSPKVIHKPEEVSTMSNEVKTKGLVQHMPVEKSNTKNILVNLVVSLLVIAAGIGSGWGLSQVVKKPSVQSAAPISTTADAQTIKVGDIYGAKEINGFKDPAEGVLVKGGLDGEGTHHLLRTGGKSQTAYLTSSVIDLDPFIGHKVKVWGETFQAQKASWLMDVGRVEVVELNAEKPFAE